MASHSRRLLVPMLEINMAQRYFPDEYLDRPRVGLNCYSDLRFESMFLNVRLPDRAIHLPLEQDPLHQCGGLSVN